MVALRDLVDEIEAKYGNGTIRPASTGLSFVLTRFSTGIFDFDAAIGGGPPWGRFLRVYGPFSGGKSALWLKAIAGVQGYCRYCRERFLPDPETDERTCGCPAICSDCNAPYVRTKYKGGKEDDLDKFNWARIHDIHNCKCLAQPKGTKAKKDRVLKETLRAGVVRTVWLDAENCYDRLWAAKLSVDNEIVYVVVPEYAEQGVDVIEAFIRSGEIDIVVVDSIADLVPSGEIEASTEEWQIGLQARLVNKAMRKWSAAINRLGADSAHKPIVLLINQTRDSMTRGEVTPGGWQQYFRSSIDVRMFAAKYEIKSSKRDGRTVEDLCWADMGGIIKKNKTHPPRKRFSFRFYLSNRDGFETGSTNEYGVVLKRALEWDIIDRRKTNEYVFQDYVWKTQKQIVEQLLHEHALFWEIRDQAMTAVLADATGS